MKRKLLSLLVLFIGAATGAWAYSWPSGGCTVTLVGGTLTVSGSGAMDDYDVFGDTEIPWDAQKGSIKGIIVESGVTHIGANAFSWCSNLASLTLRGSVTIGYDAFYKCVNLTTLTLGDGLTTITSDINENSGLDNITTVNLPSTLKSIGENAFKDFGSLTTINLHEGLKTIGNSAFYGCESLDNVTIPSSVTTIGDEAFQGCKSLSSLHMLEGDLNTIGQDAFLNCSALTSVTIPSSVTSIGSDAFYGCISVTHVYCRPNAADLTWEGDHDFIYDGSTVCHVRKSQLEAYESTFGEESENPVNVIFDDGLTQTLAENVNNSSWITSNVDKEYEVTLTRTLQPNGWNTFCVPFAISSSQIASVFGAGTEVKKLASSSFNASTHVLTLNFEDASSIEAGKPYLVWIGSESSIANPSFSFVKIVNGTTTTVTDNADFVPVMNPTSVTANDKDILFVSGGNKLTWPTNGNINGFRAYFHLHDTAADARSYELSFDGEVTAIQDIEYSTPGENQSNRHAVYDLQGRQVFGQMSKGMYIMNGKKVFIK